MNHVKFVVQKELSKKLLKKHNYVNDHHASLVTSIITWLKKYVNSEAHLFINSQNICPGDIFFAINFNGIDNRCYLYDAIQRGAAAIIFQSNSLDLVNSDNSNHLFFSINKDVIFDESGTQIPCLSVDNLGPLIGPICSSWYHKPSSKMLIIGITGTNGKTSTSYWIASALSFLNISCGIIGTLGAGKDRNLSSTGFTTPDATQLQLKLQGLYSDNVQAISMEVSSHGLTQHRVSGVAFDIAILTNCTQDHLDYHQTLANYRQAKAELFAWPNLTWLVINCHDVLGWELIRKYVGKKKIIAYTMFPLGAEQIDFITRNNIRLLQANQINYDSTGLNFQLEDSCDGIKLQKKYTIHVPFFGVYNVENLLAVTAVCLVFGVSMSQLAAVLSKLPQIPGRMQFIHVNKKHCYPKVIVDYAHTPDALKKNLEFLVKIKKKERGRIIVVFGCGGERDVLKRPIMGRIAAELADFVVITNDNPRHENPKSILNDIYQGVSPSLQDHVIIIEHRAEAIRYVIENEAKCEDFVLIAGKGHETTQSIAGKEYIFSDVDCAKLALHKWD